MPTMVRIDKLEDYADKIKRLTDGTPSRRTGTIFFMSEGAKTATDLQLYTTFTVIHDGILYTNSTLVKAGPYSTPEQIKEMNDYAATQAKADADKVLDYIKKECPGWQLVQGMTKFV